MGKSNRPRGSDSPPRAGQLLKLVRLLSPSIICIVFSVMATKVVASPGLKEDPLTKHNGPTGNVPPPALDKSNKKKDKKKKKKKKKRHTQTANVEQVENQPMENGDAEEEVEIEYVAVNPL